jgi:hypothetical protein
MKGFGGFDNEQRVGFLGGAVGFGVKVEDDESNRG